MFKKLKKLYFKIYHLFKLISIFLFFFVFSTSVYADCDSVDISSGSFTYNSRYGRTYTTLTTQGLSLNTSSTYTFYVLDGTVTFRNYFSNTYNLDLSQYPDFKIYLFFNLYDCDLDSTFCSGTPDASNRSLLTISGLGDMSSSFNSNYSDFHFIQGDSSCITPPTPPPSDNVFNDFLVVFTDRFSFLTTSFTSNPYLFTFIVIIFSFIVLELFFKLFNLKRGRY